MRESLVRGLRFEGYEVTAVTEGGAAIDAAEADRPDVAVLDVMMPHVDGLTACRVLRQRHPDLPILMLTARHEVRDRVAGLDAGADDYLVKPYAMSELAARLRALLRRTSVSGADDRLEVGDLVVDPSSRRAWRGDRLLDPHQDRVRPARAAGVSTSGWCSAATPSTPRSGGTTSRPRPRSLDVYIGYLRQKTEADGEERVVHTVRGVGYVVRRS